MMDTIKDYLVSVGFEPDKASQDQTTKSIDSMEKTITKFAASAVLKFGEVTAAVATMGAAVAFGAAKMVDGLGNQEIQMEMLARTMWTTQQQAYAFSLTMKALGANLQELYLSPTLLKQYEQLHKVATQMQTPSDYNQTIGVAQNLSLGFKQMKLEASYALQWIGYALIKDLAGPLATAQNWMDKLNNAIIKNMPTWTANVAKVIQSFIQGGAYIGDALKSVYNLLMQIANYLPTWTKVVAGALAIVAVMAASNPFFLIIESLAAVMLLLDDYYTYMHGGKSALGPFWENLNSTVSQFYGILQQDGVITNFQTMLSSLKKVLDDLGISFGNIGTSLNKNGTFANGVNNAAQIMNGFLEIVTKLLNGLDDLINLINANQDKQISPNGARPNSGASSGSPPPNNLPYVAANAHDKVNNAGGGISNWIAKFIQSIAAVVDPSALTPAQLQSLGVSGNPSTYIMPSNVRRSRTINAPVTAHITVQGSGDPQSTANSVVNALNQHHASVVDAFLGPW